MTQTTLTLPSVAGSLSAYLAEISRFPMLEPEQEYMLAKRYQEHGDLEAAHKLTTSHLRLAAKVAFSFRHYGLALADLISEANIGLMQAIKKFDPDKGFRLATYAIWWIKATISEYVLKSWSLVKIGTIATQKRLFYNLHKIKAKLGLYAETGLSNDMAQKIADMLGVSSKEVMEMEQRLEGDTSLNTLLNEDGTTARQDMLVDPSESVEERLADSQDLTLKRKLLLQGLAALNERERVIIQERFLSENPTTLEELGTKFQISRERVRQIESKAYAKLKAFMCDAAKKMKLEGI